MSLFTLQEHVLKIDPDTLVIPEFRVLWERDKSKDKAMAYKELSYVYYYADFKSSYQNYTEDDRESKVRDDFIRDSKWRADKDVIAAVAKYEEMQVTPTLRLLQAAKVAVDKLAAYFRESEPEDRNYTSNLDKLGKIVESLDKLEEKVKKEQSTQGRIRGGGDVKSRER